MDFFKSRMNFLSSVLASLTLRDMSSVTLSPLPFKVLAFLRTSSRSLYSSNVTNTGLQPDTSGPLCIRQT